MRIIRQALGLVVSSIEKPLQRFASSRPLQRFDDLALYHYPACPFCIRVRCAMHYYRIRVELVDIDRDLNSRDQLIAQGGKSQVPCLRIEQQGEVRWLYESAQIIAYLKRRMARESSL